MNDAPPPSAPAPAEPPSPPVVRRRWHLSLIWLVPLTALVIGLGMLVQSWRAEGPEVTITFRTAAGLEPGKTPVKYKDVTVGKVTGIALDADGGNVLVKVALVRSAAKLTRKDTRYWVVRPRINSSGVSGIDTLLSGAYIGADAGLSEDTADRFTGLETPPAVIRGSPGKSFRLYAADIGSLDIGSPVYYRRILVGHVTTYQLSADGRSVDLQIFVDAPFDRFVSQDARFWNASGVDASVNAEGFRLKTQSIATIVAGGIAFDIPVQDHSGPAPALSRYALFKDQQTAMAPPDGPEQYLQLRFQNPLRGLSVGAPVQFSGVDLGRVTSVDLDFDPAARRFPTVVGIVVYPQRLGRVRDKLPAFSGDSEQQTAQFLADMVAHGLRARARTGNLLTGQLYIGLDFVKHAPPAIYNPNARPLSLPTMSGGFDQLQDQIAGIVAKIDRIPLESIGNNLNASLGDLDKTLKQVDGQLLPQGTQTLQEAQRTFGVAQKTLGAAQGVLAEDAPLQQNIGQTLLEVQKAARSMRTLTDMLGRHPEALVRGLKDSAKPAAEPETRAPATEPKP